MTDEQTPDIEEIKDRIKVEIDVEEETVHQADPGTAPVTEELRDLGRQFAETVRTAWTSEERQKLEGEIRDGIKVFVNEVDNVFNEIKSNPTTQRAREEASQVLERVDGGDVGRKTRRSLGQGLRWLSEELNRLADQFTAPASTEVVDIEIEVDSDNAVDV